MMAMQTSKNEEDAEYARLNHLLDLALAQLHTGDGDSCVLALQEALVTANQFPKRPAVIYLLDQSK